MQFALNPESSEYFLIEVNPRVSRSSALASKASGYPIARVTAKIALGMALEEIPVAGGNAAMEPSLDYIVAKFPRFPFDKFTSASNALGTQMKATGEVMGIGSNLEECMLKSVRSLETGVCHLHLAKFDSESTENLLEYVKEFRADTLYAVTELLRRGESIEKLHELTMITRLFLESLKKITDMEKKLAANKGDAELLREAKKMGFGDETIGRLWGVKDTEVYALRKEKGIVPVFRMVDTLHTGKYIAYLYSSYSNRNDSILTDKKKIVVLGAGPIRIGQGVEFDYSTVHAVQTIRRAGYEAIIINNNPETVSTDYTTADKLYFEPLTPEDVMAIIDFEKPEGVIASLGGQTAINLAQPLMDRGVKIIGTDCAAIERAENRDSFEKILLDLGIPQPKGQAVTKIEDGVKAAEEIGYPVLVRPSFVLGGRAMQIVANEDQLRHYLKTAVEIDADKPVLVDKYIRGKEVEVDAICDGRDVFVPGIMELVERTGIHSGDSISVYPAYSSSNKVKGIILQYAKKLGLGIGIVGLYNIQFIVDENEDVYIIEVNPRSSRTVPFLSKSTGYSLADIATEVILGKSLKEQGIFDLYPEEKKRYYVKVPVFSFNKIKGLDAYLSPEMKSTGEAIGYDNKLTRALYKALQAGGTRLQNYGTVMATIADRDKAEALPLIRRFYNLGFNIEATSGTARFLKENGIRTHALKKISEGSSEIPDSIRQGHVAYIINTSEIGATDVESDGLKIRQCATENNATIFTSRSFQSENLTQFHGHPGILGNNQIGVSQGFRSPGRQILKITENIRVAENVYKMVLEDPELEEMKPGQFVNIRLDGLYLRRPISVCESEAGSLTIIYKVVGKGTEQMSRMKEREKLDVLTGLGNGYDLSKAGDRPLLLGGGVGVPPLVMLARKLREQGKDVTAVLGFNTMEEVTAPSARRASSPTRCRRITATSTPAARNPC